MGYSIKLSNSNAMIHVVGAADEGASEEKMRVHRPGLDRPWICRLQRLRLLGRRLAHELLGVWANTGGYGRQRAPLAATEAESSCRPRPSEIVCRQCRGP